MIHSTPPTSFAALRSQHPKDRRRGNNEIGTPDPN